MTTDNFDYYKDDEFAWTGILDHYQSPHFIHKKSTTFSIEITLDKIINEFDSKFILLLGKDWTWGEEREIKAFNLEDQKIFGKYIYLKFVTIRKSKRYDEIKYFLFDLGAFIDQCEYKINEIIVNEIS